MKPNNYIKTECHEAILLRAFELSCRILSIANRLTDWDEETELKELNIEIIDKMNREDYCVVILSDDCEPGSRDNVDLITPVTQASYLVDVTTDEDFKNWLTDKLDNCTSDPTSSPIQISADFNLERIISNEDEVY